MTRFLDNRSPLVIIGAGRSGTNALRDAMCTSQSFATWPCDEINYIWRYGNSGFETDELVAAHATESTRRYIRSRFSRLGAKRKNQSAVVVEKTCANSLRVGFVDAVLPEAKLVFITRDGRDVASSAMLRWKGSIEPLYLARKARFVPRRDLPTYGTRFLMDRLRRNNGPDNRLPTWGPRFAGMDRLTKEASLASLAAEQWAACVRSSTEQLQDLPASRVLHIRYADLVSDPVATVKCVGAFAGVDLDAGELDRAKGTIHSGAGKAWSKLDIQAQTDIASVVDPLQIELDKLVVGSQE